MWLALLLQGFAKVPRTALVKATHGVFHTNPELVHQTSPNVHLVASPSKHAAARVAGLGSPHKHNGAAGAAGVLDDVPTKIASFQEFVPHLHDASEHSTSQVCKTIWEDSETHPRPCRDFQECELGRVRRQRYLHVGKSVRCAWDGWCVLARCCVCVCAFSELR